MIVERRAEVPRLAAALPAQTGAVLRQVSTAADAPEIQTLRPSTREDATLPTQRRARTITRATRPSRTHITRSGRTQSSDANQGIGASGVMRLAGKLQQLIHLAEHERKLSEARSHVRMASEESRSEVEGGLMGGGESPDAGMNLELLQEEVLREVQRRLEIEQQRSGESDGNGWW